MRSRSRPASETTEVWSRPALLCGLNGGGDVTEAIAAARAPRRFRRAPRGDLLVRVAERNAVARRAPRQRRSRAAADRRRPRRAARGRREARDEHRQRAERAGDVARARRRPAACPPAGRGCRRAAAPSRSRAAVRRPIAVPALPRASSATSGFSFCGMIDDPVAASSGRRAKPNSLVVQRTSSSPIRERWVKSTAARRGSRARSRGRRPHRSSCAARSAAAGAAASSRQARRHRAARGRLRGREARSACGRARASRPTRAGGGRA